MSTIDRCEADELYAIKAAALNWRDAKMALDLKSNQEDINVIHDTWKRLADAEHALLQSIRGSGRGPWQRGKLARAEPARPNDDRT